MSLLERLKKRSTIKESSQLSTSSFFQEKDLCTTSIPALNIALSGSIDGGFGSGLIMFAGPSKHFKTGYTLVMMKAYMDKYPESVVLFYDTEFGSPQGYFDVFGIDTSRVFHTPVTNIEELKFDIMQQLGEINKGDRVFIAIDSIGNIASKKEVEDALDGKSVADMTRAKQLKSLFRMVTPQLTVKNIPMVVVNHSYMSQEMFSRAIVSGGTGPYYSANSIFLVGKQQEKDGGEIAGWNFVINVEKSRFTREKSKIPVLVTYDKGISKWSGLLDIALESGHVVKPKNGWYAWVDMETGEVSEKSYRAKQTETQEFWDHILPQQSFHDFIEKKYRLSSPAFHEENVEEYLDTEDESED